MTSFSDILNKRGDQIERPKPLPVGHYMAMVKGLPEQATIGKSSTPALVFILTIMSPLEDVDQQSLMECGGAAGKTMRHTLYLQGKDENAQKAVEWRLRQFLEQLGCFSESKTLAECIQESPGRALRIEVSHRPSDDCQMIYTDIKSTSAA